MSWKAITLAAALLLASAGAAFAQMSDISGQIVQVVPEQQVVVLSNGQMYRVTTGTTLFVNSQPVTLTALQPGQAVVIRSGERVALQNGQYVVVGQAVTPVTPVAPAPPTTSVVVAPPATAVPAGVRQTIYGRVEDVDNDGTVKIAVDDDSFKVKLSRDVVRSLRKGDRVQLDMTVAPAGTPAASPR